MGDVKKCRDSSQSIESVTYNSSDYDMHIQDLFSEQDMLYSELLPSVVNPRQIPISLEACNWMLQTQPLKTQLHLLLKSQASILEPVLI